MRSLDTQLTRLRLNISRIHARIHAHVSIFGRGISLKSQSLSSSTMAAFIFLVSTGGYSLTAFSCASCTKTSASLNTIWVWARYCTSLTGSTSLPGISSPSGSRFSDNSRHRGILYTCPGEKYVDINVMWTRSKPIQPQRTDYEQLDKR